MIGRESEHLDRGVGTNVRTDVRTIRTLGPREVRILSVPTSGRRLDVKQAAEVLDISSEGVRKRIKRGSLVSEKDSDGKVWVWLDGVRSGADVDWTGPDGRRDVDRPGQDGDQGGPDHSQDAVLTEALRDQVAMLQSELEDWKGVVSTRDEELRRKDHIIAALTERIPELEPVPGLQDAPQTASESTNNGTGGEDREAPQERRSWLYRFFFGP